MKWLMATLLALGGVLCCLNFYLSFLRCLVHRMSGKSSESYRHVSGIPLLGSLLVAVSLFKFWQPSWLLAAAIGLILVDTGGLHWFLGTIVYDAISNKAGRQADAAGKPPPQR